MNQQGNNGNTVLYLASGSPRRREILSMLGIKYEVLTVDTDETCEEEDPGRRVTAIAAEKCRAACRRLTDAGKMTDNTVVLTADTLVYAGGRFLGKPRNDADAREMLELLSGATHAVYSGICLYGNGKTVTAFERTDVTFDTLTEREMAEYVQTGEPYGKAGGYAIQGLASRYISGIHGDYFNVVGLPVRTLYRTLLREFGVCL